MRTTIVEPQPQTGGRAGWFAVADHRPVPDPTQTESYPDTEVTEASPLDAWTRPLAELGDLVPAVIADELAAEIEAAAGGEDR